MNDDLLIDEALAGQSAAFGQLVERYQDRLYNTMVHVVGCHEAARDVVQDAFVQAFVKLDTFQRHSAFYTWLYRIAFNMAVSHRRRQKPRVSLEQTREMTGHEPVDDNHSPEDPVQRQERAEMVHAALANLTEEHREVLVLREMEGCDYERIAEILDVPIGTVRSRLFRARMQLRDLLKTVLQEDFS